MRNNRVVVISTFFDEGLGYQEVHYARVLARMGYDVMVVSTDRGAPDDGQDSDGPFKVVRIRRNFGIRHTIYPIARLRALLGGWDPSVAFVLGPNHCFPYVATRKLPKTCKVVCYFGDHGMNVESQMARRLFKDRWYRWMFRRCDSIIPATPATQELLEDIAGGQEIRSKVHHLGLLIDPATVGGGSAEGRAGERLPFVQEGQKVLSTVTLVRGKKAILPFLRQVSMFLERHEDWDFVLYGMMENDKSDEARRLVEGVPAASRMHLMGVANEEEVERLYRCSDLCPWFSETISIQKAMMHGCPVVVPDSPTMRHLVSDGINGFVYGDPDRVDDWNSYWYPTLIEQLADRLADAASHQFDPAALARRNRDIDAEVVVARLLDAVGAPSPH